MKHQDYLLEIGVEELPPKSLSTISKRFGELFADELKKAQLTFTAVDVYATPRRLALKARELASAQPEQTIERRGPSVEAAFDEAGNPTKAATGFARSCGVDDPSSLEKMKTDKGEWLVYRDNKAGAGLGELIEGIVTRSLDALPVERAMRWGTMTRAFIRPVHYLVSLYGNEVLPLRLFGITAGRESLGHRFMSSGPVTVDSTDDWLDKLREAFVLADFAERRHRIEEQLDALADSEQARVVVDPALLDEVTALVEWPEALCGRFDPAFLQVPEEVLISAMKSHQRYFHLVGTDGKLLPRFVTIANIRSSDPSKVIQGNERVITPRLSDASFFFEQDKKTPLADKLARLKNVVFQSKLGTYYDKAERISSLAGAIAGRLDASADDAARAALLCKADLVTDMVGEFPDLQGIMGGYYAAADGEPAAVSAAIREHYQPVQSGGDIPPSISGQIVALADKLDTLTGIFGIGQPPTGSRDPFALRRQALGVLRILLEGGLSLDLFALVDEANAGHDAGFDAEPLKAYLMERLAVFYQERGIGSDVFEAARHSRLDGLRLPAFDHRVRAIAEFRAGPEAESLAAANKRVANLLRQAEGEVLSAVDPALFESDVERALYERVQEKVQSLSGASDDGAKLKVLATLREPVDKYFDDVLVMTDDEAIRRNRLATLKTMRELFLEVADVSMLQVQGQ